MEHLCSQTLKKNIIVTEKVRLSVILTITEKEDGTYTSSWEDTVFPY